MILLVALGCGPAIAPQGDATGLSFAQEFTSNEDFEPGGVIEGKGGVYLYLDVTEGPLGGYVAMGTGDITIDGRRFDVGEGAVIEGAAWWLDDERSCYRVELFATGAPEFQAAADGCRQEPWISVTIGLEDPEETFTMVAIPPDDPFLALPD